MICADLAVLPLLMMLAYAVRAGSLQVALQDSHWLMWLVPFGCGAHAGSRWPVPYRGALHRGGRHRDGVRSVGGAVRLGLRRGHAVAPGAEAQRLALLVF